MGRAVVGGGFGFRAGFVRGGGEGGRFLVVVSLSQCKSQHLVLAGQSAFSVQELSAEQLSRAMVQEAPQKFIRAASSALEVGASACMLVPSR